MDKTDTLAQGLNWWLNEVDSHARVLPNVPPITHVRLGPATRLRPVGLTRTTARLEVSAHHLRTATETPAGDYIAAYTAHRADMGFTSDQRSFNMVMLVTLISVAGFVGGVSAITGGEGNGAILFATVLTLVSGVIAVVTWKDYLRRVSCEYHRAVHQATHSAGALAADGYLNSGAYQHKTALHNIVNGVPATPARVMRSIAATIPLNRRMTPQE